MLEFLPEDIRKGLLQARDRQVRRSRRLSVHMGDAAFPVLRLWEGGFAVDSARTPRLRGLVDLYDGPRHLSQCLIVAASEEGGTTTYEFKRETRVVDHAPRDYADERGEAPSGLLPRPG
jgi:hypothetical protein